MFETSVVRALPQARGGRFGLLTTSIVAHSAVILGAVMVSVASVDFPASAPDEYALAPLLMQVQIPPPLGRPDGGAPPRPTPQPEPRPARVEQPAPSEVTAPSTVPESVTPVDAPATGEATDGLPAGEGAVPGPIGVPWGTDGSTGALDAPPGPIVPQAVEPRVYQPHEVKSPRLVSKVEPVYPPSMARAGVPATVVVRCIVDKYGRVHSPEVIAPAMEPFNAEVLRVVTKWRFTPGSVNGTAVDSFFHLTVTFRVRR
jgi:periplasmic protein TonB